jgi:predicted  nucleic acid-binding Zn-ribbon protein
MYTQNHTQLTALEKLEDKFDDIIQDLSDKIDDLTYDLDNARSDIGDLNIELGCDARKIEELENQVSELESQLDNLEEA